MKRRLDDLPREMLARIVSETDQSDRSNIRLVSKQLKTAEEDALLNMTGVDLNYYPPARVTSEFLKKFNRTVRWMRLSSHNIFYRDITYEKLEHVILERYLSNQFITGCETHMPRVKTLSVAGILSGTAQAPRGIKKLPDRIQHLTVNTPRDVSVFTVSSFLPKTLVSLHLIRCTPTNAYEFMFKLDACSNIQYLTIQFYSELFPLLVKLKFLNISSPDLTNLAMLYMRCPVLEHLWCYDPMVSDDFSDHFTNLRCLQIKLFRIQNEPHEYHFNMKRIKNICSHPTLTTLILNVYEDDTLYTEDVYDTVTDYISQMPGLKILGIYFTNTRVFDNDRLLKLVEQLDAFHINTETFTSLPNYEDDETFMRRIYSVIPYASEMGIL